MVQTSIKKVSELMVILVSN